MKLLSWWASSPDKPLDDRESRLRFRQATHEATPGRYDPPALHEAQLIVWTWDTPTGRLLAPVKELQRSGAGWEAV